MMYDELVKNLRENVKDGCSDCTETAPLILQAADAFEDLQDKFKTLMHKYIRLAAHTEWIPVTKRLPPISEEVIVFTDMNMIRIWSLERYYPTVADVFWEREDGYHEDASVVTHWMPLPKPPESEGE